MPLFPFRDVFPTATFILPACDIRTLVSKTDTKFCLSSMLIYIEADGDRPDLYSLIWVYVATGSGSGVKCSTRWLLMERHLCVKCVAIPQETRTSFRLIVCERMCAHIKKLFDIDIEILSDACSCSKN
jgi:hypothetical protein